MIQDLRLKIQTDGVCLSYFVPKWKMAINGRVLSVGVTK